MDKEKNDYSHTVTTHKKLYSKDSSTSLLCIFDVPAAIEGRLAECLKKCISNCEKYCQEQILPQCAQNGIYVYKLKITAEEKKSKLIITAKATLSDRRACKILVSSAETFKYRI